jgi:hypothetical protein
MADLNGHEAGNGGYSQRMPTAHTELLYSEYKLDGSIPIIEGTGKTKVEGKVALQAFGIVSYDDETGTYHLRAYNDSRYLETDLKTSEDGKGLPGASDWAKGRPAP